MVAFFSHLDAFFIRPNSISAPQYRRLHLQPFSYASLTILLFSYVVFGALLKYCYQHRLA